MFVKQYTDYITNPFWQQEINVGMTNKRFIFYFRGISYVQEIDRKEFCITDKDKTD